jgi:RND family efflux transporter MFP subunit
MVGVVQSRRMTVPIMAQPIGTTVSLQDVSIRARVRGFLKEIHFQEGADVKAGQLLCVIDEEPFQASLTAAQAALDQANAELNQAQKSQVVPIAAANLAVSQASLAFARIQEDRNRKLMERLSVSREEYEETRARLQQAEADAQAKQADLDQAKIDFTSKIALAQAQVEKAQANLVQARLDLSYCRMSSPIDGRVGFAGVKLGNLVGPAAAGGGSDYTELVVVRQLDPMGVDMEVSSRYLDRVTGLLAQGVPITVYRPNLDGEENLQYPGKAVAIDNSVNPTSSTFKVRAEVANPRQTMLPGEYVKLTSQVGELPNAVVVPEAAVVETQAGWTVATVDPQGKIAIVPVEATITHDGLRVIASGLQGHETVVTEGVGMVRPGMTVRTRPAGESPANPPAPEPARPASPPAPEPARP